MRYKMNLSDLLPIPYRLGPVLYEPCTMVHILFHVSKGMLSMGWGGGWGKTSRRLGVLGSQIASHSWLNTVLSILGFLGQFSLGVGSLVLYLQVYSILNCHYFDIGDYNNLE